VTVVLFNRFDNPHLLLENLAQAFSLVIAKFQHDPPMRLENGADSAARRRP